MEDRVTAIVCDDAPGFRALLSALLEDAGVEVVARGETWAEAVELAPGIDAVVVDLWMPELELDALATIREITRGSTLAVVTALDLDEARTRIGDIDVDLLLSKIAPPGDVAAAIRDNALARRGGAPVPEEA